MPYTDVARKLSLAFRIASIPEGSSTINSDPVLSLNDIGSGQRHGIQATVPENLSPRVDIIASWLCIKSRCVLFYDMVNDKTFAQSFDYFDFQCNCS